MTNSEKAYDFELDGDELFIRLKEAVKFAPSELGVAAVRYIEYLRKRIQELNEENDRLSSML